LEGNPAGVLVKADVAAGILASRKLASLTIEPASATVAPGGSVSFSVGGVDQNGQPVELSGAIWKAEGGTIDHAGVFTAGKKDGTFKVEATVGSHGAVATVLVSEKAPPTPPVPQPSLVGPKRFHGTVALAPSRVGRDAGQIAEEVVAHLEGLAGSDVKVTLEIEARFPSGAPENVVRTVTENCRTLKFTSRLLKKPV
jgi:hypothetical protein